MQFRLAGSSDLHDVSEVIQRTITSIYPKYYREEIVTMFLALHNEQNISRDISSENVYVLLDRKKIIGTGTCVENHITRIFVLPEYEHQGFGTYIMDCLETILAGKFTEVVLDASLPACDFYYKRGYRTIDHGKCACENGVILSYELMQKKAELRTTENLNAITVTKNFERMSDRAELQNYKSISYDSELQSPGSMSINTDRSDLEDKNRKEPVGGTLRLRPYKNCDAKTIVTWVHDKTTYYKWCADRFEAFPLRPEDMNRHYMNYEDSDNFFPMTAFDESGVVGHYMMRFIDEEKKHLHFGFVIVDDSKRGCGYGKKMLQLALAYAFDILKVDIVTLGVFENNLPAHCCYLAAGFEDSKTSSGHTCEFLGEKWNCIDMEVKANRN